MENDLLLSATLFPCQVCAHDIFPFSICLVLALFNPIQCNMQRNETKMVKLTNLIAAFSINTMSDCYGDRKCHRYNPYWCNYYFWYIFWWTSSNNEIHDEKFTSINHTIFIGNFLLPPCSTGKSINQIDCEIDTFLAKFIQGKYSYLQWIKVIICLTNKTHICFNAVAVLLLCVIQISDSYVTHFWTSVCIPIVLEYHNLLGKGEGGVGVWNAQFISGVYLNHFGCKLPTRFDNNNR